MTDRGGQLCHAAIVAREYGFPAIVGTREATRTIPDGARCGSTGGPARSGSWDERRMIHAFAEARDPAAFGGKAVQFGVGIRAGLPVPAGFAVSADHVEAVVSPTPRPTPTRWRRCAPPVWTARCGRSDPAQSARTPAWRASPVRT